MTNFEAKNTIKLTIREHEILKLIAAEHTSQEMAEKLSVSMATIESHRRNMIKKFGVRNSVGIVKLALNLGFL